MVDRESPVISFTASSRSSRGMLAFSETLGKALDRAIPRKRAMTLIRSLFRDSYRERPFPQRLRCYHAPDATRPTHVRAEPRGPAASDAVPPLQLRGLRAAPSELGIAGACHAFLDRTPSFEWLRRSPIGSLLQRRGASRTRAHRLGQAVG